MATPYEVEHDIKPTARVSGGRRRVDMSTFTSHLHTISPESTTSNPNHNPHATPNPVDHAALFRLVQDQMGTLAVNAPTDENRDLLRGLFEALEEDIRNPPGQIRGVSQQYLDALDRVPRKQIKEDDACPICAERYLGDEYCLVVKLPCHDSHRFDLECVGPWLQSKGTCPMCRTDLTAKKEAVVDDEEEDWDRDGLYG